MKKTMLTLATSGLVLASGFNIAVAQDDDDDGGAVPVEIYTCKYADGMGPADLDAVIEKWNAWSDEQEVNDYSAWILTPFYASSEQDFDVIWMGVTETGHAMGVSQDLWLANGSELQAMFDRVTPCDAHSLFAALQFKAPPEREDPSSVVISFRDCKIADGKSFADDVAPANAAWAEYRTAQGSTSGHWTFFPAYGGGGEDYDYKAVGSYGSHAEHGTDWDNFDPAKGREIFGGVSDCDSARVYNAKNIRMAESDDE